MKIAVECKSPLMQKSLEMFLQNYLSSVKQSDIVVRDVKCLNDDRCFFISSDTEADLLKPFSKSQLILALEKKYEELLPVPVNDEKEQLIREYESMDFSILEKRIDLITKEYQKNILQAVKAFYEE